MADTGGTKGYITKGNSPSPALLRREIALPRDDRTTVRAQPASEAQPMVTTLFVATHAPSTAHDAAIRKSVEGAMDWRQALKRLAGQPG